MNKRPNPFTCVAEARLEGFGLIRRDFQVTIENQTDAPITGGVVAAQWADPKKPAERWPPSVESANHVFSSAPCSLVIHVESEETYWGGVLNVDGYSTLVIKLQKTE